jgi:hypothetical protein
MATEWKVRYKDGRVQKITADEYASYNDDHVFSVNDVSIAVIDRKSVESVTRADVPDPEGSVPIIA